MAELASQRRYLADHDLMVWGGAPVVYHCHHFNLFLDQTIDDALGADGGSRLRFIAAREFCRDLIAMACTERGARSAVERLEVARELFVAMGDGSIEITAQAKGGTVRGDYLHYSHAWREKYGALIKRTQPADAFAGGFAAAAVEIAYAMEPESVRADEVLCLARREPHCQFRISHGPPESGRPPVREAECAAAVRPAFAGEWEDSIARTTASLRQLLVETTADARGLIQAFGVYLTIHPSGYYNRISYDAAATIEATAPQSADVLADLLAESGHVCVFHTFGGILSSPEWEALAGPLSGDGHEVIAGCMAIARALGFGHWTIGELTPGERLVLRAPSTYESCYYVARHGKSDGGRDHFLRGAALAIMQLAYRVDWRQRPLLTQEFYDALFRSGAAWRAEQTHCIACGHAMSEIVVTKV